MKLEDIELEYVPPTPSFTDMMAIEMYKWEIYEPDLVKDVPFNEDWYKYVYWIPRLKKEFFEASLRSVDLDTGINEVCTKYGIDHWYFFKHYGFFIKTLKWMRKNGTNHIGEVIV